LLSFYFFLFLLISFDFLNWFNLLFLGQTSSQYNAYQPIEEDLRTLLSRFQINHLDGDDVLNEDWTNYRMARSHGLDQFPHGSLSWISPSGGQHDYVHNSVECYAYARGVAAQGLAGQEPTAPLDLYWSAARKDTWSLSSDASRAEAVALGYVKLGTAAYVPANC
jgi:hypothetical protein